MLLRNLPSCNISKSRVKEHGGTGHGTVRVQQSKLIYKVQNSTRARASSQEPAVDVTPSTPTPQRVRLITTNNCELGVSLYPNFGYNAAGGGGHGTVTDLGNGCLKATWDIDTLAIPDLDWRTGSLFRLPIPPPINIAIKPQRLEGTIKKSTGEVALDFDCQFFFSLGPLYAAPPLLISTLLTTESTQGRFRSAQGSRLNGKALKLVGTSNVPKTGDFLLDAFLMLPTDALAIMDAEMIFD